MQFGQEQAKMNKELKSVLSKIKTVSFSTFIRSIYYVYLFLQYQNASYLLYSDVLAMYMSGFRALHMLESEEKLASNRVNIYKIIRRI